MTNKYLVLTLFMSILIMFLNVNAYSHISTQERLRIIKNADIIGISKGLPIGMGSSLCWEESRGDPEAIGKNKTNNLCSYGSWQINEMYEKYYANKYLPGGYKVYDRKNPNHSAIIGASLLFDLHKQFGNWKEALCAYNWGSTKVSNIKKYSDIPLKTRQYTKNISSRILKEPHNYEIDINKLVSYENHFENHKILCYGLEPKKIVLKRT